MCYDDVEERVGMECGHYLCKECYRDYLHQRVKQGTDSVVTTCPIEGCKLFVSEEIFESLMDKEAV